MSRPISRWIMLLVALLLPFGTAAAQQSTTMGALRGHVVDESGQPVPSAQVQIENDETGLTRSALSGPDGNFLIPLLPPATYTLSVESIGFQATRRTGIRIAVGEIQTLRVELQTRAVEIEGIEVLGERADASQNGVIELINQRQIEELPVAGRDFTDFLNLSALVTLQPQVGTGGQFAIGGARSSGTNIQIDGADANNAFFGENRGSSRVPFAFSLESIREFQIITNGYDVEFGRFSGGLVNAVTRGGTNDLTGSVFAYHRGESLTADDFNGDPPADFSSWQFGGRLGGPIIEDRAHFFVAADFQRRDQPTFAMDPSRLSIDADSIQRFISILENVYGLETAGHFGTFEETDDQMNLFARVDWELNENHRLTLRNNYQDFENLNDRINRNQARTVGGPFQDESNSFVAELNSIFGDNLWNTARFQWSIENRPRPANSFLPNIGVNTRDDEGNFANLQFGGAFFGILHRNNLEEDKLQFTDNLTFQRGDHTFKIGTDHILTHTENLFWLNGNGFVTFSSLERFENQRPSFFLRFLGPEGPDGEPGPPFAEFDTWEGAFYIQDDWRVSDRLDVVLGLRYDRMSFQDTGLHLPDVEQTFGFSTAAVPEDNNNIGPRVSLNYDLTGDGAHVLNAGGGLFFGRVPTVLHGNVMSKTPPLVTIGCFGPGIDTDFASIGPRGEGIQDECIDGIGFRDEAGVVTMWDPDFQMPRTFKANLGWDGRVGPRTRIGADLIFSQTHDNYSIQNLNLQPQQFTTDEGRPVFVEQTDFEPDDQDTSGRFSGFGDVFFQTDEAEARSWNLNIEAQHVISETFQVGLNYGYNRAFDNLTWNCCTEGDGFADSNPTAGNPNLLGDIGDEDVGSWGPSDFQSRHVFVMNWFWEMPFEIQLNGIYRAQSGNPFTPRVDGDVNADGEDDNDRPYIPDPDAAAAGNAAVILESAQDVELLRQIMAREDCIAEAAGSIINRNTCNNPWFHRLDLRFSRGFETVRGQNLELIVDLFNVFDGLGQIFCDDGQGGEFCRLGNWTFKDDDLLVAEGYDEATNRVIYSVDAGFGREFPVGFEPFQFQAQLGVRYTF